ncbi:MAG: Eco57I restriction-modification methylase domain-containing protein [Nitrospira sp.]|nr:Eco57I restriction-modification methylase domain-containing protein [Nitrospira sp.]
MPGQLFTHYFLTDGIKATAEWKASVGRPEIFVALRDGVRQKYEAISRSVAPNEAVTEQDLIRPVLDLLGWTDYLPQQGAARNEDIPDHLLFADAGDKRRATAKKKPGGRYRDALVVQESKRFGLALDAHDKDDKIRSGTPHGQILRYLSTAETASEGRIRWGILTNGGVWRLYDYHARPRASGYFEADLAELLKPPNEAGLRVFHLLFRRDSFILQKGATTTFLEAALAEGRRYEERVAQDLSGMVFERVFPNLVQEVADATDKSLAEVREAALIFLYRLLFVLYAEDRGLLPVNDSRYDDYGLRKRVRDDIAHRMADGDIFSTRATSYYDHLMTLFRLIDKGDPSIGLPPYNGGLFAAETATLLEEARLPDATIAPIIYDLSHTRDSQEERRFVNYRDMSVQQLGSIYERLLEHEPVRDEDGKIVIRPNPYARKDSGSFFTPQQLVDLIIEQTLKPLAEERLKAFEDKAAELKSQRRPKAQRKAELLKLDPAEAVLNLKILDPAMGSGHFLVTAVDFLSDYVAELIEYVPAVPEWRDAEYASPLVKRVATIRKEILQRAKEADWVMDESQLTDQAIIRRMVLKRCIYGVDKNPLTVELAKVSLWLHSFTVGAPLSFLDHHLRYGDSLIGLRVSEATDELHRLGGMFASSAIAGAEAATEGMQSIEEMSDADVAEVRESAVLFHLVEQKTSELRGLLDSLCGLRWFTAGMKQKERVEFERPLARMLGLQPADAYKLLTQGPEHMGGVPSDCDAIAWSEYVDLWKKTISIASRERFLHWEVAFPGVWEHWQSTCPEGGFDAVIGNPPWDQIEQPEVEWFAIRDDEITRATTGANRKAVIKRQVDKRDKLAMEYEAVRNTATAMRAYAKASGNYPLLSGGRINLYSLFVERAMSLVKPDGFVGLLTPSGIYADKTAARFFQFVSTNGRVGGLFDFENKKIFFKDVHASFKFCAMIFGGEERRFDETKCAFFLHDTKAIHDQYRCFSLTPEDFTRVNPNTGTAPVFRTRRDAEITRRIYEQHPVLVDRSGGAECKAWPVKFRQGLFNMTSDSHLFRTAAQLHASGYYPVESNQWKRVEETYLPLYQGRTIWQFDHRANSVTYNSENIYNPYLSKAVSEEQHADPTFLPRTQYWVPAGDVEPIVPRTRGWTIAYRRIARSTDVRTLIASIIPQVGCGDPLPVLLPSESRFDSKDAACLLANLNSFSLDYISRQKVQATHLDWYTVEQLPVIAPADYDRLFGTKTARDLVRDHVLRLTYTAHDMAPFARDLGYDGPPFVWNEEERRHLRARLDALYFHLYGLTKEDAEYVLDTFPIVRKEDEATFGHYRTRDLILAYMNALSAGDTESKIAI